MRRFAGTRSIVGTTGIISLAGVMSAAVCLAPAAYAADPGPLATSSTWVDLAGKGAFDPNVVVSRDGARAFVIADGSGAGRFSVIDIAKGAVVHDGAVPMQVSPPSVSADGSLVAAIGRPGTILLDPNTGSAKRTIKSSGAPGQVLFGPQGKQAYQVDEEKGRLLILDARTLKVKHSTPFCPRDFADVGPGAEDDAPIDTGLNISPDGKTVLVGCYQSGLQLFSAKTGKRIGSVPKALEEGGAAFSPDGGVAYVAGGTTVSAVDLNKGSLIASKSIYLPGDGRKGAISDGWSPVITTDGTTLYIPWRANGTLKAVDTKTLSAKNIVVGGKTQWFAQSAALSPDGSRLYVLTNSSVVTIDPATGNVLGIDQAVPEATVANSMAVAGSKVLVGWSGGNSTTPQHAGVTILTMPNASA